MASSTSTSNFSPALQPSPSRLPLLAKPKLIRKQNNQQQDSLTLAISHDKTLSKLPCILPDQKIQNSIPSYNRPPLSSSSRLPTTPSKLPSTPSKLPSTPSKQSSTPSNPPSTPSRLTPKPASKHLPKPSSNSTRSSSLNRPSSSHCLRKQKNDDHSSSQTRPTSSMTCHSESTLKSPKNSSQAFREMLAEAKRNKLKLLKNSNSASDQIVPESDSTLPWGFQPVEKLIEKALRTGKINLSSRMLSEVPQSIYDQLLLPSSIWHPSNRPSHIVPKPATINLSVSQHDRDDSRCELPWYERVDLSALNLSLNELTSLDDQFGGFDALVICDLRHNQLASLPASFGLLINLTLLNLSSNKLDRFPIPIMSLVNLKELNLSDNLLTELWPTDWKPTLKKQLAQALVSVPAQEEADQGDHSLTSINGLSQPTSTLADSSFGQEEFCDQFPSSPTKAVRTLPPPEPSQSASTTVPRRSDPLPGLEKLFLSQNRLTSASVFGPGRVSLPPNLAELDLSRNALREPIDVSTSLLALVKLTKLDLSGCEFGDSVFRYAVECEYDQLADAPAPNPLFEKLVALDLSHNAIDSLGPLEAFFGEHCQTRRLRYDGLPGPLARLATDVGTEVSDAPVVAVRVGNNFLRDEGRRRRAARAAAAVTEQASAAAQPAEDARCSPAEVDALEAATRSLSLGDEPGVMDISEPASDDDAVPAADTVAIQTTCGAQSEAERLFVRHFNAASSTLDLHALKLDALPFSESYTTVRDVRVVELAQNALTCVPAGFLGPWAGTLR